MTEGTRNIIKHTAQALGLAFVSMSLFKVIQYNVDLDTAASLRTPLDDAIPFVPSTVYLYSWIYTAMLYPLFVVKCPKLFRQVLIASAWVLGLQLLFFALYPVSAVGFRPDASELDMGVFHNWAVRLTFHLDPPTNLFPSQHMSASVMSMLLAWKARRSYGVLALPVVIGVGISICTMKQHYIADGVSAIVLAGLVYWFTIRRYDTSTQPQEELTYTWRGPVAYVAFHSVFYAAFIAAWALGWELW